VDPYADAKLVTDFAVQADDGVRVKVLTTGKYIASLTPAAKNWATQHGPARPLEVRIVDDRKLLHDRLILADGRVVAVSQSFKDLAMHSPSTLLCVDPEIAKLKVDHYEGLWAGGTPVT
jgi:hypothetical protein